MTVDEIIALVAYDPAAARESLTAPCEAAAAEVVAAVAEHLNAARLWREDPAAASFAWSDDPPQPVSLREAADAEYERHTAAAAALVHRFLTSQAEATP